MIDVTIKMVVAANMRNETLITIKDLLGQIRREADCLSCHCYLDVEVDNVVIFGQEWKTNKAFKTHLRSNHFKVLLGAMKLLLIEPEISVKTVVATENLAMLTTQGG